MFSKLGVCLMISAIFMCSPVASQVQNCGQVQNVSQQALSVTASTLILQWALPATFPSACVQQLVVCWSSQEPDSTTCRSLPSTTLTLQMTDLEACTTYDVRVTVKPLTGTSTTATFSATTSAASATNVTASWVSGSSLRVSWHYHAHRINCMSRFLAAVCNSTGQEITNCRRYPVPPAVNVSDYSVAVQDLPACQLYYIRVVTETTLIGSLPLNSAEIPFYLDAASVTMFNATEVSSSAMRVSWSMPQTVNASCQHTFTACAVPVADGRQRCAANVSSPTTVVNITNLRPCTAYQLRLSLSTPGGENITLGPVLPTFSNDRRLVSSVQLTRTRDQVLARWTPVFSNPICAKGYRVCWNESTGNVCEFTNTTTTSFTIVDLDSGAYIVEVAGVFFDDSLSNTISQTARISGATPTSTMFTPISMVLAVATWKVLQIHSFM